MRAWLFGFGAVLTIGLLAATGQGPEESKRKADDKGTTPTRAAPAKGQPARAEPVKTEVKETKAEPAKGPDATGRPGAARSRVVKVTVYPNSALVTREVEVPPGQGLIELVVPDLPERVQHSSLYGEGAEGLRVLTTRYRTRPVAEDTREDVRKLEDELKRLRQTAQKIQAEMATAQQNLQMLMKLEGFTEKTTVQSTEKGGLNGDTVITLAKYVMEQRGERAKEQVALQQQLQENQEQAEYAQRQLRDLTAGSTKVERDAVVVVDREAGAGGRIRLNYLADAASWRPQYKLRAGGPKDPVKVDYQAALTQQTGEDWGGVDLTLSTAQPMLNAAPPDLRRLEVAVVARGSLPAGDVASAAGAPPVPGASGAGGGVPMGGPMPVYAARPGAGKDLAEKAQALRREAVQNYNLNLDAKKADAQLNEAAAYEQTRDLMKTSEELVAHVREQRKAAPAADEGPSVNYHLDTRLTVPSRTDEQVIEIAKVTLEPKYYYKAVPVLARHVYRLADLANTSPHVLLPGEATMYQGADFVGRMALPLVAIGEEFTAGFGVDPQVQVVREMVDKARTTQGGNQVLNYKYRILVSSYKADPVRLQVWDRLPHAETETAGITLVKASPDVSKDALYERENRPHNLLRWDLDVAPNRTGERAAAISYEFRLELDRNMAISGLLSR